MVPNPSFPTSEKELQRNPSRRCEQTNAVSTKTLNERDGTGAPWAHEPRSMELRELRPAQQPVYGMPEFVEKGDSVCNVEKNGPWIYTESKIKRGVPYRRASSTLGVRE